MPIPILIPLVLSAISTGFSVSQGIEARKRGRAAERAADDALAAAKRRTAIDRFEGLKVPTEAYQFAADIQTQQQQQSLMALQEAGPRALAAGVGKITAAGIQGTEEGRQALAADLFGLKELQATEAAKRDASLASIDLQTVEGAGLASMASEQQAAAAFGGGLQTLANTGMDIYKASALYGKDIYATEVARALDAGDIPVTDRDKYLEYVKGLGDVQVKRLSGTDITKGFYGINTDQPIAQYGSMYDPALFSYDFSVPTNQIDASVSYGLGTQIT
jgi:hypothetical protein